MPSLIHERCFNHAHREAVARCPDCRRYYCRECITEHEDRVICAACLGRLAGKTLSPRRGILGIRRTLQLLFGVFTAWVFFYWLGAQLLSITSAVHESSVWRGEWLQEP